MKLRQKTSNYYDTTVDFHGFKLVDAEVDIHLTIGAARMEPGVKIIRFVTGHGTIKEILKRILTEYGVGYAEQLGNTGVIIAEIE